MQDDTPALPDLAPEIEAICAKLQIPYDDAALITLRPGEAAVIVHMRDDNGEKYVTERGGIASEVFKFRIRS